MRTELKRSQSYVEQLMFSGKPLEDFLDAASGPRYESSEGRVELEYDFLGLSREEALSFLSTEYLRAEFLRVLVKRQRGSAAIVRRSELVHFSHHFALQVENLITSIPPAHKRREITKMAAAVEL